jgi:hypothetical protein
LNLWLFQASSGGGGGGQGQCQGSIDFLGKVSAAERFEGQLHQSQWATSSLPVPPSSFLVAIVVALSGDCQDPLDAKVDTPKLLASKKDLTSLFSSTEFEFLLKVWLDPYLDGIHVSIFIITTLDGLWQAFSLVVVVLLVGREKLDAVLEWIKRLRQ